MSGGECCVCDKPITNPLDGWIVAAGMVAHCGCIEAKISGISIGSSAVAVESNATDLPVPENVTEPAHRSLEPLDDREVDLLRQTIAVRSRKAPMLLGLTHRGLARSMDRSPSWVREVEAGTQFAPAYLIQALSTAISRPIGWFYGNDLTCPFMETTGAGS